MHLRPQLRQSSCRQGDTSHPQSVLGQISVSGDLSNCQIFPPDSEARTITEQILQGLDFMHQSKFAHRDLKPKNLLVQHQGPNWWVKISDFGCSKQHESTALCIIVGSEPYLAPELQNVFVPSDEEDAENEEDSETPVYSLAVDIWALGTITFRIATGKVPFPSPTGRKLFRYAVNGSPFPSHERLSTDCTAFILSVMSRSPRGRPTAAEALRNHWIVSRCTTEVVDPVPEAEIAMTPGTEPETPTNGSHSTLGGTPRSRSTIQQSHPLGQNPLPSELKQEEPTPMGFPAVDETSRSWSTSQSSLAFRAMRLQRQTALKLSVVSGVYGSQPTRWKNGIPSACAFSADGRLLVLAGNDSTIGNAAFDIWERTGQGQFTTMRSYWTEEKLVTGVAVSPNGKSFISYHGDKDLKSGLIKSWGLDKPGHCYLKGRFGDSVTSWAISADARRVFAVEHTTNRSSRVTTLMAHPEGHFEALRAIDFDCKVENIACSSDGKQAVVFHLDQCMIFSLDLSIVTRFDLQDWPDWRKRASETKEDWIATRVVAFSPDGRWCIIGRRQTFRLFERVEAKYWKMNYQGACSTDAAVFSQDSERFALGSLDYCVFIWSLDDDGYFWEDTMLQLPIRRLRRLLAFSPDGQFLATAEENQVNIWKIM